MIVLQIPTARNNTAPKMVGILCAAMEVQARIIQTMNYISWDYHSMVVDDKYI